MIALSFSGTWNNPEGLNYKKEWKDKQQSRTFGNFRKRNNTLFCRLRKASKVPDLDYQMTFMIDAMRLFRWSVL